MSRRQRYYYDPDTCTYKEIPTTWTDWATYGGIILGLSVALIGLFVWSVHSYSAPTFEELGFQSENQALEHQLAQKNDHMTRLSGRLDTLARRDQTLYRRLLQVDPLPEEVRQAGVGGSEPHGPFRRMSASTSSLIKSTMKRLDHLERQILLRKASYRSLAKAVRHRSERMKQRPAIRPANGAIVSGYGMRHHPVLETQKKHTGVDLSLQPGTPVVATGNGTVEKASYSANYGRFVDLQHPESGHRTLYAHLSDIEDRIRPGVEVQRGDTIGYSGNTGRTTGPHLHYEVRTMAGETLEPRRFLIPDITPEVYRVRQTSSRSRGTSLAETDSSDRRADRAR